MGRSEHDSGVRGVVEGYICQYRRIGALDLLEIDLVRLFLPFFSLTTLPCLDCTIQCRRVHTILCIPVNAGLGISYLLK